MADRGAVLIHDRKVLTDVLVYHWRRDDSGCGCGWGDRIEHLGRSWPEHVVDVYEDSLVAVEDDRHDPMPQPGCNVCVCGSLVTDRSVHL